MEPLESTIFVLTWLKLYPTANESSKWKKVISTMILPMFLIFCSSLFLASFAFIYENFSTNLDDCLLTSLAAMVCVAVIYTMPTVLKSRHQIASVVDQLSSIYDDHKNRETARFLARANRTCEHIWSLCIKCGISYFPIIAIAHVGSIFLSRLIYGNFNVNHFFRPFKYTLPWNQSTYSGYFGEACYIMAVGEGYFITEAIFLSLFLLFCIHIGAFLEIFNDMISKWNLHNDETNCYQNNEKSIVGLIRFHLLVKEWFLQTTEIFSPIMMVQLVKCMFISSLTLFACDLKLQQHDYVAASFLSCAIMSGILVMFPYCYFGKSASQSFEQMSNSIYNNAKWYELPFALQKYIILMLTDMQKPLNYHGSGIVIVDLNTYIRQMRNVISYYLMFKSITMK